MLRISAIAALAFALTGCGTARNFQREATTDATVYGGVKIAADGFTPGSDMAATWLKYMWPLVAADVVFSAVGDTLTLPVTVPLATWRVGSRLWRLANYNNTDPPRNEWRRFWFNDESGPAPERVRGGIY